MTDMGELKKDSHRFNDHFHDRDCVMEKRSQSLKWSNEQDKHSKKNRMVCRSGFLIAGELEMITETDKRLGTYSDFNFQK
jgi:hypothetical protein